MRRLMSIALVVPLAVAAWLTAAGPGFSDEPRDDLAGITVLRDVRYREAFKPCVLDIAMPKERGAVPRPAIVVIHGGGWIEGSKSSFATTSNRGPGNIIDFAKLGFVAATINYRLSGEAPFPAALEDCQCAIRWLRANADKFHIDREHIGAYGNSAGGHLALLLGMLPPSADIKVQEPYSNQLCRVQAVASDSGPIDLLYQQRRNQLLSVIEKFMGGPPDGQREEQYQLASPVNHISDKTPPLLLIYGENDEQVDVSVTDQFVAALSKAGCKDTTYIRLANVGHCPHSLIRIPYLQQVVTDFFGRTLKPKP